MFRTIRELVNDEFSELRTFVAVVEKGSFSKAARETGKSVSAIARHVLAIEERLGVKLLNRTTRQQALTECGTIFYEGSKEVIKSLDSLKRDVTGFQSEVKGELRVQLRVSAANSLIVPELHRFLHANPDITLDLVLSDEQLDLVANRIDLAVWLGHLSGSNLIACRLSPTRRAVCASPENFRRVGEPQVPSELAEHDCLVYRSAGYGNTWRFEKNGEFIDVSIDAKIKSDSGHVVVTSCINGLGVMAANEWMVSAHLREGRLKSVFTDYSVTAKTGDEVSLYAVWPPTKKLPPKTRAFVDFLVSLF